MIPGPTLVLACAHCGGRHLRFTLESGNTFGARAWTDGKYDAPMLPSTPWITRCSGCGAFFRTEEAEVLERFDAFDPETPDGLKGLPPVAALSAEDLLTALANGVARTADEERILRVELWWAGNDAYRDPDMASWVRLLQLEARGEAPSFGPALLAQLEPLPDLLDRTDPEHRLLAAELARELGRFADALDLLEQPFSNEYHRRVADAIRTLARKRATLVRQIGGRLEVWEEFYQRSGAGRRPE